MIQKFIVEIDTDGSARYAFNKLDKLIGLYTGNGLPFHNNSINYAPEETGEIDALNNQIEMGCLVDSNPQSFRFYIYYNTK